MMSLPVLLTLLAQVAEPGGQITRIPAPGGEVVLASPSQRRGYEQIHYAPVRRVGDTIYVSGIIAGAPHGKVADSALFQRQVEELFRALELSLKAAGSDLKHIVKMNSFHVWTSPHFSGSQEDHFRAFSAAKNKFVAAPFPAWTAVGTTGLLAPTGLVEVEVIAIVPPGPERRRGAPPRAPRSKG